MHSFYLLPTKNCFTWILQNHLKNRSKWHRACSMCQRFLSVLFLSLKRFPDTLSRGPQQVFTQICWRYHTYFSTVQVCPQQVSEEYLLQVFEDRTQLRNVLKTFYAQEVCIKDNPQSRRSSRFLEREMKFIYVRQPYHRSSAPLAGLVKSMSFELLLPFTINYLPQGY